MNQVSKGHRTYGLHALFTGSFAVHHVPVRSIALEITHVLSADSESRVGQKRRSLSRPEFPVSY